MSLRSALIDVAVARPFAGQRVLLTGSSGFLGWQVAAQAVAGAVQLHSLGRTASSGEATHHHADLTDRAAVARAVAEAAPQAVIHCAAPGVAYGSAALSEMLTVAALGTANLLDACAALAAPPRVVLLGSGFEYALADQPVAEDWPLVPSGSHYGAAKAAAAAVAGAYAERLPLALLRPFHIYGAGEAARRLGPFIIAQARADAPVELTAGEQRRDFLHVDDCAAMVWAMLAALGDAPGLEICNLGSGQPIMLREFIAVLVEELARHSVAADCRIGALPYRSAEPMVSLPDLARWQAKGLRAPRISLAAGVADLVRQELAQCA